MIFKKKRRKYTRRRGTYSGSRVYKKSTKRSYKRKSPIFNFFSFVLAIISISALILLISVVIAEISNSDKTIKKDIMSKIFTRYSPNDGSVSSALKSVGKIGEELPLNLINDELLFKICLISDIHEDDANLKKAFEKYSNLDAIKYL